MTFLQSYNPTVMRKEDLRAIFVARKKLLQYALKRIKESGAGKSKKHLLLVGPRGSGKTHLQLLIYYAIKDSFSKQWLALKFPEEEYSITSLADLLLCILQEMGQEDIAEAEKAKKLHEELCSLDEAHIEEQAIRFIKEYHSQSGKNFLLLLENFQDLATQLDSKGMHSLRAFIQENDFLMLFPSALSVFRQVADYGEPFYGFFEPLHLKEISLADTKKLLLKLARREKQDKQDNLVKKIEQEKEKIKGIYNLTGGNVRLNVLVYHVISYEALLEVETALYNLLDELTPYYQYQMNVLSVQQRKILNSMALYKEGAIQPKQLAQLTRIDPRGISNQLKQLKELGYVKSRQIGRIARYEMTERLFRIWRETRMRKGKDSRINFLLELFKYFYTPLELLEKHNFWKSKYQTALESGCEEAEFKTAQTYHEYLSHIVDSREFKDQVAREHLKQAVQFLKQGEFDKTLSLAEQALAIDAQNPIALVLKGVVLGNRKCFEEALVALEQALQFLPLEPKNAIIWLCKGMALGELKRYEEALAAFEQATKLEPKNAAAWHRKGDVLEELNRHEEALAAFEQVIHLEAKDASGWFGKGTVLGRLGRYEEALAAIEQSLQLEPKDAHVWFSKGLSLVALGRCEEALAAINKALGLEPELPELPGLFFLLSSVATETENLGIAHQSFVHALDCLNTLPEEEQKKNIVDYFKWLFEKPKPDFIERALNETLSKFPEMQPLLKPFSRALQYLQKPDEEQLKSLHPEEQAIVRDILGLGDDGAKS